MATDSELFDDVNPLGVYNLEGFDPIVDAVVSDTVEPSDLNHLQNMALIGGEKLMQLTPLSDPAGFDIEASSVLSEIASWKIGRA